LVLCFCINDFCFYRAEDGIRDRNVTGVQTCALPIFSTFFAEGVRNPIISSFPVAYIRYAVRGSPAYFIFDTDSNSLSPGRVPSTIFHNALDARDAPHSKTAICSTSLYARSPFVGCNNFAEISLTLSRLSTTVWIQSKIKLGIKNACCSPT